MLQLGIRLHDVKKAPLNERLSIVHDQGFSCVHLALGKVIDDFSVDDAALTPGLAVWLKRQFDAADLDIAVLGCYLNLADPAPARLASFTHRYQAHIRLASQLGCGVVGTETGAPNSAYEFVPECHTPEALSLFIDNLMPVVEYAEKMGVILAIEPVFRHIVWNPQCARKVLDTVHSPNLQIIFDPVNLLEVENYEQRESVFAEAIDLLGEDIAVIHIKDFRVENGALKSMAAGTGIMNYDAILRFARERKPFIQATLEDTVPDNAVAAAEFIRRRYEMCGG